MTRSSKSPVAFSCALALTGPKPENMVCLRPEFRMGGKSDVIQFIHSVPACNL